MKIEHLNATFQPAKIGHPHGLQVTYLKDNSTRNIFVYHEDGKVGAGPGAAPPPPSRGGQAGPRGCSRPRPVPTGAGRQRGPRAGAPRGQQLAGLAQRLPAPPHLGTLVAPPSEVGGAPGGPLQVCPWEAPVRAGWELPLRRQRVCLHSLASRGPLLPREPCLWRKVFKFSFGPTCLFFLGGLCLCRRGQEITARARAVACVFFQELRCWGADT